MPYDPELVAPMRQDMVTMGAQELTTETDVASFMEAKEGTALLFVNSVCGCAAGAARPGLRTALGNDHRPDRVATVFAGQDVDATAKLRSYFPDIPPSSPSAYLVRDGELVFFWPRHQMEGRDAPSVAFGFVTAFDEHCE
ncbi:MAG: BrxA/BrxB family bacilliredoxin [Planctomycetota bacterium]